MQYYNCESNQPIQYLIMKGFISQVKRRANKGIKNLVTSYEANLTNSIMTNKSMKTDKSTREPTQNTQRMDEIKDFDEYDDIFQGVYDSVFVNSEEEKRIYELLEFARRGKITSGNAFQIPVKVINSEFPKNTNLRFWKFASELLNASICIYDKRVDNTFQTTNQVFGSLVRTNANEAEEAVEETYFEKSRRKKDEAMRMDIAQIGGSSKIKYYQIGQFNREQSERITIKDESYQFYRDPIFLRTLKTFDANSLKGLFLNIFETNKYLSINFFIDQNLHEIKCQRHEKTIQVESCDDIPCFIKEDLNKLSFIPQNRQIYEPISQYIKQRLTDYAVGEKKAQLTSFQHNFTDVTFTSNQLSARNQGSEINESSCESLSQIDNFSFNFVTNEDIGKQLTEALEKESNSSSIQYPISQYCSRQCMQMDDKEYSIFLPRELEFRGMKLQRKKTISTKMLIDKPLRNVRHQSLPLQFEGTLDEQRDKILKVSEQRETKSEDYNQEHLLPLSKDAFFVIYRKMHKRQKQQFNKIKDFIKSRKSQKWEAGDINPHNQETNLDVSDPITPYVSALLNSSTSLHLDGHISVDSLNNLKTFGLRNIREMKQSLYSQLEFKKKLALSQLRLPLSSSSTFLILLHIANEYKLRMQANSNESDVFLYYQCS